MKRKPIDLSCGFGWLCVQYWSSVKMLTKHCWFSEGVFNDCHFYRNMFHSCHFNRLGKCRVFNHKAHTTLGWCKRYWIWLEVHPNESGFQCKPGKCQPLILCKKRNGSKPPCCLADTDIRSLSVNPNLETPLVHFTSWGTAAFKWNDSPCDLTIWLSTESWYVLISTRYRWFKIIWF